MVKVLMVVIEGGHFFPIVWKRDRLTTTRSLSEDGYETVSFVFCSVCSCGPFILSSVNQTEVELCVNL